VLTFYFIDPNNPGTVDYVRGSLNTLTVEVSTTPLPPTWTMMLIGLAGIGFVAYRRKSKQALMAAAA
jgi:hypothetical protein